MRTLEVGWDEPGAWLVRGRAYQVCIHTSLGGSAVAKDNGRSHGGIVLGNPSGDRSVNLSGCCGRGVVEEMSRNHSVVFIGFTLSIVVVDAMVNAELWAVVVFTVGVRDLQVVDALFEAGLRIPGE